VTSGFQPPETQHTIADTLVSVSVTGLCWTWLVLGLVTICEFKLR